MGDDVSGDSKADLGNLVRVRNDDRRGAAGMRGCDMERADGGCSEQQGGGTGQEPVFAEAGHEPRIEVRLLHRAIHWQKGSPISQAQSEYRVSGNEDSSST